MTTATPTIIELCGKTGNMLRPWAEAGWHCLSLDTQHSIRSDHAERVGEGIITYRWADVRSLTPSDLPEPGAIFAFPPCTHLAGSGARDWGMKAVRMFIDALEIVDACWQICRWFERDAVPWMLEQPVGRLSQVLGPPSHRFQPWQYGDNWTKQTCLWSGGGFVMPEPILRDRPDDVEETIWRMPPGVDRANKRSETPMGFARAVHEANEANVLLRTRSKTTTATEKGKT